MVAFENSGTSKWHTQVYIILNRFISLYFLCFFSGYVDIVVEYIIGSCLKQKGVKYCE